MAAERPKHVVKKPKRFVKEFSRSMTVTKTEARKGAKRLFDVEVTELDKVNKRVKIHFVDYSTPFDKWRRWLRVPFQMPFPEPNLSPIYANYIPNRLFARWRHFTTKTRLLLVVSIGRLIFELSVYSQERGYI